MSLTARVIAFTAVLLLAQRDARADEPRAGPSAALFAGYGFELERVRTGGLTSYGFGFGCRGGTTLPYGLYVGGSFTDHVGSLRRAEDSAHTSTYRASYHDAYVGPEIGWDFRPGRFVIRPYATAGVLLAIGRTDVRQWEQRDDRLAPFVAPGLFGAFRLGAWSVGLDARMTMPTDGTWRAWAPSLFGVIGRGD